MCVSVATPSAGKGPQRPFLALKREQALDATASFGLSPRARGLIVSTSGRLVNRTVA